MNIKLNKISKLILLFFVIILSSCEKEGISSEQKAEVKNNNISIQYVSGKNIPNIISKINPNYGSTFKTSNPKSSLITDSFGSISVENILEVIDSLGNKNYSFTLTPKKPKPNSIFNLVVSNLNGNMGMAIVEYRMAPNFAQEYYNGTKTMSEFTGKILKFPFKPASNLFFKTSYTCIQNIDEVINCDEVIVDGGTIVGTGGGGSTTINDTNTYTGGDGGTVIHNYGGGGGSVGWICNEYNYLHSGPTGCGNGTGTWVIILSPDSHTSKLKNPKSKTSSTCCDETESVGTSIIAVNLFNLAANVRNIMGLPPKSKESLWLTGSATIEQVASISNFLEVNNNSTESINFSKELINQMMLNPTIYTSIIPFFIEKNIDFINLDICSKSVFLKIKETTVCDISQVLAKLDANNIIYSTTIKSEVAPSGAPAQTIPNSKFNYTIYISTDYTGKTKLFIANSLMHELVHAYFLSIVDDYKSNPNNNQNLYNLNSLPSLFQAYCDKKYPPAPGTAQDLHHLEMANYYVDAIARALQEFQTGIPVAIGASPEQIYSDLAWGGLNGTPVFDATYPVGNPNRQRIINRAACEQNGTTIDAGTPNTQTPIGNPCY